MVVVVGDRGSGRAGTGVAAYSDQTANKMRLLRFSFNLCHHHPLPPSVTSNHIVLPQQAVHHHHLSRCAV